MSIGLLAPHYIGFDTVDKKLKSYAKFNELLDVKISSRR